MAGGMMFATQVLPLLNFNCYLEVGYSFDIYDLEGKNRLDLFYLGDILRSLKLNPTLKLIEKFGGTANKGEKFVDFDQFCKIYCDVRKSDELGTYEDFLECLKLYDKHQDGKMLLGELENVLQNKGN